MTADWKIGAATIVSAFSIGAFLCGACALWVAYGGDIFLAYAAGLGMTCLYCADRCSMPRNLVGIDRNRIDALERLPAFQPSIRPEWEP